jgi:two-component system chemotaxis response regulator CheY
MSMLKPTHSNPAQYSSAATLAPTPAAGGRESSALDADELHIEEARNSVKCVLLSADRSFCNLVRSYLQHMGYCVFTCSSSGRAEQQFLDRSDIDLWVVDVEALGADAIYLAARVRELHSGVPIVVISETSHEGVVGRPPLWPGWIRMYKPVQLPDLLAVIQRALAHAPAMFNSRDSARYDAGAFENDWMTRLSQNHSLN